MSSLPLRHPQVLIQQARDALRHGNHAEALGSLSRLCEENPGFADVRNYLGVALHLAGRSEEALVQFRQALEINPLYAEVHLNQALVLNDLGRLEEARASFERAAEAERLGGEELSRSVSSRLANLHAELGEVYADSGRHAEAAVEFRRALGLAPAFHDIRIKLGHCYLKLGKTTLAASEFGKVVANKPESIPGRIGLGLAHFRAGDTATARRLWEECRERDPNDPTVRVYMTML